MMESLYLMPFAIFHIFPTRHGPGTSVFTALGCMDLRAPKLFAMLLEHHHPKKKDKVTFFFQLCQEYLDSAFLVHQEDCLYTSLSHYFSIFYSGKVCYLHLSQSKPNQVPLSTVRSSLEKARYLVALMCLRRLWRRCLNAKASDASDFLGFLDISIFRYFDISYVLSFSWAAKTMQHKDTSTMPQCGTHH